jgi:hypothetical protein
LIRVAVGRDPDQAMPIKGTFTGAADVATKATVDVQVRTLTEAQAPTPPAPPPPQATPSSGRPAVRRAST